MEQQSQDGQATARSSTSSMTGMSPFAQALMAGAFAGTAVDLSLYPIDTLKTRLQSAAGFRASGGFRGIYAGIGSAALGAAPGAALFFVSYESSKAFFRRVREDRARARDGVRNNGNNDDAWLVPLEHMAAASLGEIAACAVRVPTEVVKQRAQAGAGAGTNGRTKGSSVAALMAILGQRRAIGLAGVWRELYRGWGITVMREVPFTVVQFPLWEAMKGRWMARQRRTEGNGERGGWGGSGTEIGALESGLFGSVAGAVAAAVTTPLDVLKTRMMLATGRVSVSDILADVLRTSGPRGLLAGIGPRVAWISAGGAVFLGSYQWAYNALGP